MGEGRGHAARARAMVERLRDRHKLVLFSSADGLSFLDNVFGEDPEIAVHEIPGVVFHYTGKRIDYAKTIRLGLSFWASAGKNARALLPLIDRHRPNLAI